jgi:putative ABC transport system substrate-binding protein
VVLSASSPKEIETAFDTFTRERIGGLIASSAVMFLSQRTQLVLLAARHAIPTIFWRRDFAVAGALASYGTDTAEGFRLAAIYAGRILKGAKPADLPVQQSTKFQLIINLKTAKALGITVPLPLLGRADEVIE